MALKPLCLLKLLRIVIFMLIGSECLFQACYAQDRITPTGDNTLTYAGFGGISSIDPAFVSVGVEFQALNDLFDGLFYYDVHGEIVNGLVDRWTLDDSQTVYTFDLKQDSHWSDGVKVTANDFVLQLQRLVDPEVKSKNGKLNYLAKFILNAEEIIAGNESVSELGIKAVNESTLEIRLKYPVSFFVTLLAHPVFYPVPSHVIKEHGNAWTDEANFVSNGSYLFDAYHGVGSLRLQKNYQHKYAEETYFEYVEIRRVVDYNRALTMLSNNKADILDGYGGSDHQVKLQKNINAKVDFYSSNAIIYIKFNLYKKKLQDVRVRQAMSYALFRGQLEERLSLNSPVKATYTYSDQSPDMGWFGMEPDWANESRQELIKKAQSLMRQAGYGPDKPLRIEIKFNEASQNVRFVSAVAAMWAAIWIEVKPKKLALNNFMQAVSSSNFEVARYGWGPEFDDPAAYFLPLSDDLLKHMPDAEKTEFYKLSKRLLTDQNRSERGRIVEKLEKKIMEHVYIIPVIKPQSLRVMNSNLQSFKPNFLKTMLSRNVRPILSN